VTRYAVFLRAVNVGGHNKVPMATLREIAAGLGYADAVTHLQSGNLVVDAPVRKPADVESAVSKALQEELGLTIDVMARTGKQLATVIAENPFAAEAKDDPTKVHVSFLAAAPPAAARNACDPEEFAPERFSFGDCCLYLWFPNGAGRSKLATAPWAKRLGVPGTARNWRTVTTMRDLVERPAG
jgi:uncharacterized protein (DUF1697 family)